MCKRNLVRIAVRSVCARRVPVTTQPRFTCNKDSIAEKKQQIPKHNPMESWKKSLRKLWHGSKEGNFDVGFNIPVHLKTERLWASFNHIRPLKWMAASKSCSRG